MKALVYGGPGTAVLDRGRRPEDQSTRATRSSRSTRSRSAAPTCTSSKGDVPEVDARPDPRPRGRRHRRRRRQRRQRPGRGRPGARVLHLRVRRLPLLPRRAATASAAAAAAGSSATSSTASRPSTPGSRSRTCPPTSCPRRSATRPPCMLADILPTSYEVGVLNGQVRPGDTVVDRRRRPDRAGRDPDRAAVLARRTSSSSTRPTARLRGRQASSAPTVTVTPDDDPLEVVRALTDGLGADVVIEAVGVPGDVRAVHHAGPARRPGRQHRRARQAGHAAPGRPVDPQRHHHHRPGRHVLDADAAAHAGRRPARRVHDGHAPVRVRRLHAGLRRVRRRRHDRRAQGRGQPLTTSVVAGASASARRRA